MLQQKYILLYCTGYFWQIVIAIKMHYFSWMPVNSIYNNNTSINAKCVIHKVFYYNLTFTIPHCNIAGDKMQNALCNIAFLILDFIQYKFSLQKCIWCILYNLCYTKLYYCTTMHYLCTFLVHTLYTINDKSSTTYDHHAT